MNHHLVESGVKLILRGIGANLSDPNYMNTPERVAKWYAEMFTESDTEWATFPEEYNDFILLRQHHMWTLCPHHLLPVELVISVAYVPGGNVLGLSKLARVLSECNNGPLLQEKFTNDVVDALYNNCSHIRGAACFVEGFHGCARIRGVKTTGSFITSKVRGIFDDDKRLQDRFFQLARA